MAVVNTAIRQRVTSFDAMKAIAALFVVIIHSNPFKGVDLSWFPGTSIDFVLDTTARFAVPFFFIVSGYFFANSIRKYHQPKKTLVKILWRVFWIHISWGALYYIPRFIKFPYELTNWQRFIKELVWVGFEVHLWFLPALMLSIAILAWAVQYRFVKHLAIFSLLLHLLGMFGDGQIYYNVWQLPYWPTGTRNGIFFGLFYVSIGCWWFRNPPLKLLDKLTKPMLVSIILLFVVLQILERWLAFTYLNANPDCDYYLTTIPLALSVFLFCMKFQYWGNNKHLIELGKNSMGIYVIHVAILLYIFEAIKIWSWEAYTVNILYHLLLTPFLYFVSYWLYKYWDKLRPGWLVARIGR